MPTIRGLALGTAMAAAGLLGLPTTALAAPSDLSGEGAIAVETEVAPAVPLPGEPIVQTAKVINTGSALLTRVVVQLDAGPACRWVLPVLASGQEMTLTCADVADTAATVVKARARGTTGLGRVVQATAGVRIDVAIPAREPAAPRPPPAPGPATPPPAVVPAAPDVLVAPVPAPVPPPAPPPGAPPAAVPAALPAALLVAAVEPTVQTVGRTGPLANPARTAGIIAIVTVMVMTAAVGALGGTVRVR